MTTKVKQNSEKETSQKDSKVDPAKEGLFTSVPNALLFFLLGSIIAWWVLFYPQCQMPPKIGKCSWLGISLDCIQALDDPAPFNYIAPQEMMCVLLLVAGTISLARVNWQDDSTKLMRFTTSFYAIISGLFWLFRARWGAGRPLLVGAALHNLAEWNIVIQISIQDADKKNNALKLAAGWIGFLCILVVVIPDLITGVAVEQSFGIMLDFGLVFCFFQQAVGHREEEVRRFYTPVFWAVAIHLFYTILPLVFSAFAIGEESATFFKFLNELMIYLSSPTTHLIYLYWAPNFDGLVDKFNKKLPDKFLVQGILYNLMVAFLCGFIPLVFINQHTPFCPDPTVITGTSVANVYPGLGNAFQDRINQFDLVGHAKAAPGNVDYHFYRSVKNSDEFRFVETWKNPEVLQSWIQSYPQTVFTDPAIVNFLIGGTLNLQGGYAQVAATPAHGGPALTHGGMQLQVACPCDKIWKLISDWNNCRWVVGCTEAFVDPKNRSVRTLHLPNGQKIRENLDELDPKLYSLQYTVLEPSGYHGHLTLINSGVNLCNHSYNFQVDGKVWKLDDVQKDFINVRIPALKAFYASFAKE